MGNLKKNSLGTLGDVGTFYVKGENLEEIKEISNILENVELGEVNIEWEKQYLRELFSRLEVIAFKEEKENDGINIIGIRPINITIEKAYISRHEKCNRRNEINYTKTQKDNAWTEFKIPASNCKLILYHRAIRENKYQDF